MPNLENSDYTLVLLPGMIGTADLFQPLLEVIPANVARRVIEYPTDQVLSIRQLLERVEAQLRDESNLIIVGESFSGAIALLYAAAHPRQVKGVVLSAAFVKPPWPKWLRIFITPAMTRMPLPAWLIRWMAAGKNASGPLVNQVRSAFRVPDAKVLAHRARESLSTDFSDALIKCQAPILYLAPDADHMVRRSSLEEILRIRPDVQVQAFNGPHLILQIFPLEAWQTIEMFARQVVQT